MEVKEPKEIELTMQPYKTTEAGVVPFDWEVKTFGELCTIRAGGDVVRGLMSSHEGPSHPYPIWANAKSPIPYGYSSIFQCPAESLTVTARGDIGFAVYRDKPYCPVGRLLSLVPNSQTSAKFIAEFINARVAFASESTGVPQLTGPQIATYSIVLPPTPDETHRIADALHTAEVLIESLEQLLTKKRQIKQGAMQELLTGKRRLPGFVRPWEKSKLSCMGVFLKGAGVKRDEALSGDLPCIRYGEIYTAHSDHVRSFTSWISPSVAASATLLRQGDLLFAGSGETKEDIGKCVALLDQAPAYAGGDILILRPTIVVDSMFLGYLLNVPAVVRQKASKGQGDAVVHINAKALGDIDVKLPEAQEQAAIAQVLYDMDAELATLEARLTKARALKQAMAQALLTGRIRLVAPAA
ncbi:restriction endonuclease subunit S [Xanthomonas oryzae]|uniref:restriction endonuclease subunit S n=1 Tax=Xanthomonas oryzae TaxID=347 RepID=UPI000382BC4D|nr:restriction endonuclease subunit S [Xanthomonas oryzae]QBG84611.1 restriction endonuclease subunit S [Xanthomonas oryzae]